MTFQIIREPEFARRIAECRRKTGLRQTDCARAMGVSRQHWSNWEIGYCKPKGKRLEQLATLLNCDRVWLQHGEGSDIEQKLENVMTMLRMAVRDLEHINRMLNRPSHDRTD